MIIKYTAEPVPKFDGIIFIDCWNPQEHEVDKNIFFYRLSGYFDKNADQYQQIVNASVKCKFDYNDQSMVNTMKHYCWNYALSDGSKINSQIIVNAVSQFDGEYSLFSGLKHRIRDLSNCHYIVTFKDFLDHWHNAGPTRAQHWLIVGTSWQNCIHNNDIGLVNMAQAAKYLQMHFYTMEDLILTENNETPSEVDFNNDQLQWIKYHDSTVYKLVPMK